MAVYTPPYTITDNMLSLVSEISEKVGQMDVYKAWNTRPHLRKNNKIQSIHSSLKIEANSLSLGTVRDIIAGHSVIGSATEIREVKNAYAAYEVIKNVNPYSLDELKKMQGILTQSILSDAGTFRRGEEGVFNGDVCIFMAPSSKLVPQLMTDLFQWMCEKREMVHPLILSAVFHYEFVFIHPFSDGNGRTARLWHTILLTKWKPVFEFIPLESQIEKFQKEYYDAIAACHVEGNSNQFIEFILQRINSILDEVSCQMKGLDGTYSEYVRKLMDFVEYGTTYKASEIMEGLGLKSKETLRKNYLNPALELGLLVMTIPDKPKSKNQCYIRK